MTELVLLSLAVMLGSAVQAATGFGFAILAAPVFLAVLNSTTVVPILLALHVVQCIFIVPRIWAQIPWPSFLRLALGATLGCPLGFWLFGALDVRNLKLAAGILILLAATLLIYRRLHPPLAKAAARAEPQEGVPIETMVTGTLAGALTAVLVMPGPPLMVHLLHRPMAQEAARALSLSFFAACYVAVLAAHVWKGSLDKQAWTMVAWLVGPVLAGTAAGIVGMRWLREHHFAIALYGLLIASGLGALLSALL